jgi:hypothetical protein
MFVLSFVTQLSLRVLSYFNYSTNHINVHFVLWIYELYFYLTRVEGVYTNINGTYKGVIYYKPSIHRFPVRRS